jgi:hypothetical protein
MQTTKQIKNLKRLLTMVALVLMTAISNQAFSQNNVGINTTTPHASAVLDAQSTTQGFLPPRMTYTQRQAIANPANGLVVFCTDCGANGSELQVYFGGMWRNMVGGTAAIPTPPTTIGQSYGGGKVAYFLQPSDPGYDANVPHGLIAAPSDQGTAAWGCAYTDIIGADGTAIGTGNQNTIDIMNDCATADIAARLCGDLVLNGYSDWYLPSKNELFKLYTNRATIGGFANAYYWSSSEYSAYDAWSWIFTNGILDLNGKNNLYNVRAVRSF